MTKKIKISMIKNFSKIIPQNHYTKIILSIDLIWIMKINKISSNFNNLKSEIRTMNLDCMPAPRLFFKLILKINKKIFGRYLFSVEYQFRTKKKEIWSIAEKFRILEFQKNPTKLIISIC